VWSGDVVLGSGIDYFEFLISDGERWRSSGSWVPYSFQQQ
jgi:hypothetical protein